MRQTLLLALLLAGCAPGVHSPAPPPAAPAPAAPPADPYAACWTVADPDACAARTERELIARTAGRVERLGDALVIHTTEGGRVPLENRSGEGDSSLRYRYHRSIEPLRMHLVAVSFYEGGTYVLVDERSGNQTHVMAPPLLSPDGRRFAAASLDLEAGYGPNGLQVWSVTGLGPRLEWEITGGESWGASDPAWLGPDVVEFTRHTVVPRRPEPVRARMRLVLSPDGLHLSPAPR